MTSPDALQDFPLELDQQLCFALYSTSLAMTKAYKPLLEKLNLTYPQYLAMLVLWETDDLTVKEIAARLSLDSATMTPLLKRLEAQGYVERVRGVEDERQVHVRLSDAGRALRQSARAIPTEIYCASGSDIDAILRLRADLVRLRASINEYIDQ
ncbi:MarR family transcriptional regulator [Caballeronia novacaledonica]|uniref:MarR family transcriptional regulator n=1 Tax=Caballeronia novacaledonica TaxID=1544861 RepID=A0A2U3I3P3_9BURK|nr:MarR family transcriptional regulator [Caballeronia novacaledonica]SPB14739.1 MarR family transcriptional regulator [Caballeronia novacaledonica]